MTEVLSAPGNGPSHFVSSPLHRSSSHSLITFRPSNPYIHSSNPSSYRNSDYGTQTSASAPSTAPSSPQLEHHTFSRPPSFSSTPASSLSLDPRADLDEEGAEKVGNADDDDILFPSFEGIKRSELNADSLREPHSYVDDDTPARNEKLRRTPSSEFFQAVNDDQAVEDQPTRHVDYLSHEWREQDLWSSWRYIVARRKIYANSVRLENASWRTWAKTKYRLKTVSPEQLNWYAVLNFLLRTTTLLTAHPQAQGLRRDLALWSVAIRLSEIA
jgi:Fungal protein of unknown function (DUF1752)